jgi:hypothetical protein
VPISPEFDEAVDEIASQLDAEENRAATAGAGDMSPEERLGLSLLPGRRVVDRVLGVHGVVVCGTIRHILIPSS